MILEGNSWGIPSAMSREMSHPNFATTGSSIVFLLPRDTPTRNWYSLLRYIYLLLIISHKNNIRGGFMRCNDRYVERNVPPCFAAKRRLDRPALTTTSAWDLNSNKSRILINTYSLMKIAGGDRYRGKTWESTPRASSSTSTSRLDERTRPFPASR